MNLVKANSRRHWSYFLSCLLCASVLLTGCPIIDPDIPDETEPRVVRIEITASQNIADEHLDVSVMKDGKELDADEAQVISEQSNGVTREIEFEVADCGCFVSVQARAPAYDNGTDLRDILMRDETGTFHKNRLVDDTIDSTDDNGEVDFSGIVRDAIEGDEAPSALRLHAYNINDGISRKIDGYVSSSELKLEDDLFPSNLRTYTVVDWKRFKHAGTTTGYKPFKLIDENIVKELRGVSAGDIVYKADGSAFTLITGYDAESNPDEVDLDDDIFDSGDDYIVYLDKAKQWPDLTTAAESYRLVAAGADFSSESIWEGDALVENLDTSEVARILSVVDTDRLELDRDIFTSVNESFRINNELLIPAREAYATHYSAGHIHDSNASFGVDGDGELNHDCFVVNLGSGASAGTIGRVTSVVSATKISVDPVESETEVMPEQPVDYIICRERRITCKAYVDDEPVKESTVSYWSVIDMTLTFQVEDLTR